MLEFRKEIFADERDDTLNVVGQGVQRQDILGHVTGRTRFFDDHGFAELLHLKVLRSPHHHARLRRIDVSAAARMPGVRRIVEAKDVPLNRNTLLSLMDFGKDDEPSLAEGKVRYRGEPVVAVIAETEAAAHAAVAAIRVDYETLTPVFDVAAALQPGAPIVNEVYPKNHFEYHERYDSQRLRFGDVERGFREADIVLEERYQMSPIEHAPTETNGSIAAPEGADRFVVHSSSQGLFFSLGTAAKILKLESNRLHYIGGTVGGGFGGKVDSLTEPLAVLGAMLTGKPVRYVLNREEEMLFGSPRGAEVHVVKDGVMRDGRIVARQVTSWFDAGAYTRLTSYGVIKCAAHIPGPYTIPNVHADVRCVYTNRVPATAMRGFGVTGVDFALEVQMDKLAHAIGMDAMEFRILNAYRDGDMKAHRRVAHNTALVECVQVAAEKAGWPIREQFRRESSRSAAAPGPAATARSNVQPSTPPPPPARAAYTPPAYTPPAYTPPAYTPTTPVPPPPPTPRPPAPPSLDTRRFSSTLGRRR